MRRRSAKSTRGPVHTITSAPARLEQDVRSRQLKYLFSMGIRTVCFVLAIVTDGVLRWVLIVAAIFLPYIAVIIANAGRSQPRHSPPPHVPAAGRELPLPSSREGEDDQRSDDQKTQRHDWT